MLTKRNPKQLSAAAGRAMLQPIRRNLKFSLEPSIVGNWHGRGGPLFANLLNTFSIMLPVGERFFIDSVRAFRDDIEDPELKKAVTAFIGQEAMHGREHEALNEAIFAAVPSAERLEARLEQLFAYLQKRLPASACLSATIALEHFTALLADALLRDERVMENSDPGYAALWRWHALEETEHKAVAYDVWEAVMGKGFEAYALRTFGQVATSALFWTLLIPTYLEVLRSQGQLTDVKGWYRLSGHLFGRVGALRRQFGNYLSYFKPNFHPWDHDNSEHLEQMSYFLQEYERLSAA